ncbi:MAG: TIGR03435 family protein [Bryobacteraceae bacterium]|jgi:uncharacterized protein (TIGR03435 family)
MKVLRFLSLTLAACAVFAQSPPRLEFEVASIKASPPLTDNVHIGMRIDGAQVYFTAFSLKDYIRIAYRVKDYQVEGPDWIASERFDIAAKLPAGAAREQVNDMLQSLLVDRFKLTFHRVKKEFPVYALVVAKSGAKLKESDLKGMSASDFAKGPDSVAASGSAAGVSVDLGRGSSFTFADDKLQVKRLPTARFADLLGRFVDRPVVDMTNLTGIYDYDITVTPEDYRGMLIRSAITAGVVLQPEVQRMAMADIGESLASGLQALGLKLEARKAPLDVIVVDHAEHAPSEN